MKNLLKQLLSVLTSSLNATATAWAYLCGVSLYAKNQTKNFIKAELFILGAMSALLLLGLIFRLQVLIVFSAAIASIAFLVAWKAGDLFVRAVGLFIKTDKLSGAAEEIKKLLFPLVSASMFLAFMACVAAINGVGYFTLTTLMVWTTFTLFAVIFTVYIGIETKIAGWAMFSFLIFILTSNFLWPLQVQGVIGLVYSSVTSPIVASAHDAQESTLIPVPKGTPLYKSEFGDFTTNEKTTTDIKAKLIGRKNDSKSGEVMYEVILPATGTTSYVNGKYFYVPARSIEFGPVEEKPQVKQGEEIDTSSLSSKITPAQDVIQLKKGDTYPYELDNNEATPWFYAPTGVNYNIHAPGVTPYKVYYWNGKQIDVGPKNIGAPTICPAKFKVINMGESTTFTISGI